MICVEIEVDDSGKVSVGMCPPEEGGEPKEYLQSASDIDAALALAKEILQGQSQSPQDAVMQEMGFGEAVSGKQ